MYCLLEIIDTAGKQELANDLCKSSSFNVNHPRADILQKTHSFFRLL